MDRWINNLDQMLNLVLGGPQSNIERWVVMVLAAIAMLLVLGKATNAFGIPNTGPHYTLFTALIGVVLCLVVMVAAKLYLPKIWGDAQLRLAILVGGPVLVSMLIIAPLMSVLQKGGYIAALFSWAVSVGAAALIIVLVGAVFDMVASGGKDAEKTLQYKQDMERFLQNQ
jgi:hypothetical protein